MDIPLDYATLKVIWWALVGILLIGYALTDGYDLGVATLLPFVGKTDAERRLVINSIGPMWEGHQVWLITGGGALFAAWPFVYAVSFSGFYLAMFVVLAALILRPVGFKYRSKRASKEWRRNWDWALFIGGFVPALIFGVALGNVLQGVPFDIDRTMRATYDGGLFGLLNPFALLAGLASVAMLVVHGASWLVVKLEHGPVMDRAVKYGRIAALAVIVFYALAGIWLWQSGMGYRIVSDIDPHGQANPLRKEVLVEAGAWMGNYGRYPFLILAPLAGFGGSLLAFWALGRKSPLAMAGSGLAATGIIASVGASMFPFILPSSVNPTASLTVWDSSSSHVTLFIMLIATAIFLPIVLAYTAWVFKVLWGRLTIEEATSEGKY
ncbi:cytochrome d ubiquinol oxidase subunit II [Hyphomonas polymorpha PS728]|uniref:Cytochrome d ubiquinol oxidase subunit II n=1 Tax=Hyphomonas polymorpha PS728 TaxID=1280954 RepID=A0A062VIG3_9PROT|nr:cytochrome d ubiquinol oxidase subunit II [Hyphomonas polymorpha]KCZ99360.1 cytochrome d ubiquinol oxidase subunit II [Hyphomonas polymorpha PS728]